MSLCKNGLLPKISNTRGNAVVEFALVLPILLLVLFGITELGRMIMTTNVLNTASREGARLAAVSPMSDSLSIEARVTEVLAAARIEPADIVVEYDPVARSVRVRVTSDFDVLSRSVLPEGLRGTITLRGETVFRFEG
ncbi:MAG: pilus assembly protein [candidate division Zixibacteria bacterium]|nr:pilus assembly protein [candidate division Zixibacteria bacterium]